jgi:hypothetical protein
MCGSVNWIQLAQYMDKWLDLVNTVIGVWVRKMREFIGWMNVLLNSQEGLAFIELAAYTSAAFM